MSSVKRVSSNYEITNKTPGSAFGSNITITTDTLYIAGNMIVGGNSTQVFRDDLMITDNIITLNKGESGYGVTSGQAGIEIDRGVAANVKLRWNENLTRWEVGSADGVTFNAIQISPSGSYAYLANVYQDQTPALGGNLDLRGRGLWQSNISGGTVGNASMFIGNVGAGGTGFYAKNNGAINQEIITKTNALIYSVLL